MTLKNIVLCASVGSVAGSLHGSVMAAPDVVFINGSILTMDAAQPEVRALAIQNGKITDLGDEARIKAQATARTRVVDLQGGTLMPGFIESHGHLFGLGRKNLILDLTGVKSLSAVQNKVAERVKTLKPGQWLIGRGWDQNLWPEKKFPTTQDIDTVTPRNPVFLTRIDGHAAWANSLAMKKAQVTATTPDPHGGRIIRSAQGNPTGVFVDEAMGLVHRVMPAMSAAEKQRAVESGMKEAVAQGVTTFHDAGVSEDIISIYNDLAARHRLPLRVFVMLDGSDEALLNKYFSKGPVNVDDMLHIRGVKLMADGALGSRGAALLQDYADEPNHKGLLILDEEQITSITQRALAAGYQVATHAIGDRANQVVLNAYDKAMKVRGVSGDKARLRVEHAQILTPEDATRMAGLGVIASMQPIHAPSDSPWAIDRLGNDRFLQRGYVWRRLLTAKAHLAAGSDTPIEPISPLWGMHAFVTRADAQGQPPPGWNPAEKLTLEEAMHAYTVEGAYAGFMETKIGQLKKGYAADLVVLDRNIKKIAPAELRQTKVTMTFSNGRVVYQTPGLALEAGGKEKAHSKGM